MMGVPVASAGPYADHLVSKYLYAPHSRHTTITASPHHSIFLQADALPDAQPTVSTHWSQTTSKVEYHIA